MAELDPRAAATPYVIGDPGRAAGELPAGLPVAGPADVELSAATVAGMLIRGATVRGLLHRAGGSPRQDSYCVAHRSLPGEDARAIAVVCDGVGALSRSQEAAELVSRRLADLAAAGMRWPDAFPQVNEELREHAKLSGAGSGGHARDGMATTAVALLVHRAVGEWIAEAAWVGDSSLWHLSPDGRWTPLTGSSGDEREGEYHSTGVRALPSADGACAFRELRVGDGALFLMSDGVANPLSWSDEVQEALARWWSEPPDPFTFAAQVAFARRSHVDDRTVVAIWPDAEALAGGDS